MTLRLILTATIAALLAALVVVAWVVPGPAMSPPMESATPGILGHP